MKLKTCPFCGSDAEIKEGISPIVKCCGCGAEMPSGVKFILSYTSEGQNNLEKNRAVSLWNNRAALERSEG